ncbi:MAG: VOC family protein [Candidatus Heimdallarchaeota archaeon]
MTKNFQEIGDDRKASGIDQYIVKLDHVAYRVKLGDRETLMAELMNALPYRLFKSFKVLHSNATTTTLKLNDTLPIIVISEGLTEDSVVEKYCQKYGNRVHHLAYEVTNIEKVVEIQKSRGIKFTTDEIIGGEEEGIKQIFTFPTESSNHIIEYIQRFGDFDGFFTPSNIAGLMNSTEKLGES